MYAETLLISCFFLHTNFCAGHCLLFFLNLPTQRRQVAGIGGFMPADAHACSDGLLVAIVLNPSTTGNKSKLVAF